LLAVELDGAAAAGSRASASTRQDDLQGAHAIRVAQRRMVAADRQEAHGAIDPHRLQA